MKTSHTIAQRNWTRCPQWYHWVVLCVTA